MFTSIVLVVFCVGAILAQNPACFSPKYEKSPDNCCNDFKQIVSDNQLKECGLAKLSDLSKDPACTVYTCMLKKMKIIDANNKVNATLASDGSMYPPEWKMGHKSAVDKCTKELGKKVTDCEPRTFALCYYQQMLNNCPMKSWVKSMDCVRIKVYLMTCK